MMFVASAIPLDRRNRNLATLLPYLKKRRRRLFAGIPMVLLTNVAAAVLPFVLGRAVDHLNQDLRSEILFSYAALIVSVSLVEGTFRYAMRRILIGLSRLVEYDLRNDLFAHLQSLSPSFFQKNPTGDLMSRATNDLAAVRMILGPGIMYSVNTFFTTVLVIGMLVTIDLQLALLTLIPLVGVSYSVKHFGRQIHQRFEKIQEQFSVLTTLVQENVSGIRVVKAYGQGDACTDLFRHANDEYIRRSLSLVRVSAVYLPFLTFLLGLSSVGLLWFGGRQVSQGIISPGDFVAFLAYLAMLTWPTIALGWVINVFERGSASMRRINRILENQPEITDTQPLAPSRPRGNVEVRDLNFSYNGELVLKNVSFQVQAGETLAIVGSTGSGKSTLANLLCRLYPVEPGRIFMDGIDLNQISLATLRKSIGYVPQDTFLFSETIRENITFGKPSASLEAIQEVAKISDVWSDIQDFPLQLETFVGERGITLSGGQKQRIAISRALLVDPTILILDDALSSVDTYTEERILKQLSRKISGRTAILISHRISTVQTADQILVLKDGEVVERGNHRQLLQADGLYAELYRKQLLKEELGVE